MFSSRWPLAGLRLRTPEVELRWPSTRDDWLATRSVPVEIEGVEASLPMFGLAAAD